jgi:predicted Zn-dependent protease
MTLLEIEDKVAGITRLFYYIEMQKFISVLLILTSLLSSTQVWSSYNLPEIGSSSSRTLSPAAERELGDFYMEQIRYYGVAFYDPLLDDYLQQLTTPLRNSITAHQTYTFFIVQDPSINAFAMPGGYIGLHTGLIKATRSESEFASVIAHEMAHVSQRHMARYFEKAQQQLLPTIAGLIGSALIATQNPAAGMGAMTATMAGAQQSAINFTRENEEEADRMGMDILQSSGFDPQGMPDFFGRMWEANRYNQFNLPEFLSTHPVTEARIADTQQRASRYPSQPHKDSLSFLLVKARVDFMDSQHARRILADYQANLTKATGTNATALRYGYVLGLTEAAQYEKAQKEVKILRQADPNNIFYRVAEAEILKKRKQNAAAVALLKQTYTMAPNSQSAALYYADSLLDNESYTAARDVLRRFVRNHPDNTTALSMLSEAQGKSGQLIEAYQTRAEILVLYGDFRGAIKQLEYALRDSKGNKYATSAINARITELKALAEEREKKS